MNSVKLSKIVQTFDSFFEVKKLKTDPSMSVIFTKVYKDDFLIKKMLQADFIKRFNGLMIKGGVSVSKIFTASFPQDEILEEFITTSSEGDLLLTHHPIPMESGNPRAELGRGFIPLNVNLMNEIVNKKLSIYSCHAPLDYNTKISTSRAIAKALNAKIIDEFLRYGNGNAGLIAEIPPISHMEMISKLKKIFGIPYVDFAGKAVEIINKISIVAGGGDEVEYVRISQKKGVQAYLSGEIFSNHKSDWAKENNQKLKKYYKSINISLFGVSHASSEFLVMKTLMPKFIDKMFGISAEPIPQKEWWK